MLLIIPVKNVDKTLFQFCSLPVFIISTSYKKSMELPFLDYNQDCPNIVRMRSNILPTEKTTGRYFLFEHDRHPLLNSVYIYI